MENERGKVIVIQQELTEEEERAKQKKGETKMVLKT